MGISAYSPYKYHRLTDIPKRKMTFQGFPSWTGLYVTFLTVLACTAIYHQYSKSQLDKITFSQLTMDREHELSVEERFKLRKMRAERVCEANQWTGLDQYLVEEGARRRPNILYVDKFKMLYCVIPKVGCTNWKKVLLYLNGDLDEEKSKAVESGNWYSISGSYANDPENLEGMNFWSLNKTERLKRLDTHTKFMVTRDPFERLLSAFRNKIQTYREHDTFGDISNKIHRVYSRQEREKRSSTSPASFGEFLRHVVDKNPTSPIIPKNEHWENYWSLCYPCDIDYDYILKLETIEEDSSWLFKKLGFDNKLVYPSGSSNPSNHDLLKEFLQR